MTGEQFSNRAVDICATILSDTPPKLPLRQEYMSLGFEVVYNAEGVGKKATKNEAKRAVDEFRAVEAIKEFRKRRLFPKRYKRIKEALVERRRIEKELALPHGLSYEAYQAEMAQLNRIDGSSCTSGSKSGLSSSELSEMELKIKTMSWRRRQSYKRRRKNMKAVTTSNAQFQNTNNTDNVVFPDFLAPIFDESDQSPVITNNKGFDSTTKIAGLGASIGSPGVFQNILSVQRPKDLSGRKYVDGANSIEQDDATPFETESSDKSDTGGLNPFEDGVKFPDLLKEQGGNQYYPSPRQHSVDIMNDQLPSTYDIRNESEKEYIAQKPNWIGESKKCFNNMAQEFCQLIVVEAQVVEGKDEGKKSDKTVASSAFSVFSELSAELYNAAGMQIMKDRRESDDPAADGSTVMPVSNNNHPYNSKLEQEEWISIAKGVCGSAAMDLCNAVVLDSQENEKDHPQLDHNDSPLTSYQQYEFGCLPTPEMKRIENQKGLDPPTYCENSVLENANSQVCYASKGELENDIAEFNDRNRREPNAEGRTKVSDYQAAFSNVPPNLYADSRPDPSDEDVASPRSSQFSEVDRVAIANRNKLSQSMQFTKINDAELNVTASSHSNSGLRLDENSPTAQLAQLRAKADSLKASKDALSGLRGPPKAESQNNHMQVRTKLDVPYIQNPAPAHAQQKLSTISNNYSQQQYEAHNSSVDTPTISYDDSPTNGWMLSAKSAIQNLTSEVYKAAGIDTTERKEGSDPQVVEQQVKVQYETLSPGLKSVKSPSSGKNTDDDIESLFVALSNKFPPIAEIEKILTVSPELVQVRQQRDGKMPLHAVCDRGMPDRSNINVEALTDNLLRDIAGYKRLINLVVTLFPEACLVQDKDGNLPAHLVARGLMQWEAEWYEKVYLQASKEKGATGKTALAITKLYHNMSESVEMLLRPLASDSKLCRAPGSMGTILPLHIASIFTASVNTLRLILEAYPEGAKIPCDLGILQTFIPDESLPLELHDNLSTDFPKWEIEAKQSSHPEVRWSQSELEQSQDEDCMRRSDLLFAYNPIEPHRFEKARMRRLEARIQFEAKRAVYDSDMKKLNRATEQLWIWMCTFREPDTLSPTYVNSVKRIVAALPMPALRYLVSIPTADGRPILEQANTECLKVIQKRLDAFSKSGSSRDKADAALADDMTSVQSASIATEKSDVSFHVAPEFRLQGGRGFVSNLCRLLFNLHETSFPTSFVILPYKLALKDGKLRMASQDSLVVAAKFAECLLNLTDPRSIAHILDSKASDFHDHPIYDASKDKEYRLETYTRFKGYEESLLDLFSSGEAHLYLLDEATGLPAVLLGDSVYPLPLKDPQSSVRKLLKLMMMGMVQMRGEKAISKLANVLLDKKVRSIVPTWIIASKELVQFLEDKEKHEKELSTDLLDLKNALIRFQSKALHLKTRVEKKEKEPEWAVELSYLKELIDVHDPFKEYQKIANHANKIDSNGTKGLNLEIKPVKEEEESVDALARKLEKLSELHSNVAKGSVLYHGKDKSDLSASSPLTHDDDDDSKTRKSMISRYSALFDELKLEDPTPDDEKPEGDDFGGIKVWNTAKNVWEEVTCDLERSDLFSDDPQITKLKVALAQQARKLAFLGKKVASLQDEEHRVFSTVAEEDISSIIEEASIIASKNDLTEARKLVLRMCDLEERLLHDEIAIQHLRAETDIVDQDREDMQDYFESEDYFESHALQQKVRKKSEEGAKTQRWKGDVYIVPSDDHEVQSDSYSREDGDYSDRKSERLSGMRIIEPTEIVDLADQSYDSPAPIPTISFENRIYPLSSEERGPYLLERDPPIETDMGESIAWSDQKAREVHQSFPTASKSRIRFASTHSPLHTYELVDEKCVPRVLLNEPKKFTFNFPDVRDEIVDVTDMSDTSSYFGRSRVPSSLSLVKTSLSVLKLGEIVDVTEMSVSQPYSTRSLTRSNYANTTGGSEIIDMQDMASTELDHRIKLEKRVDYRDYREPPEAVNIVDLRDQISPQYRNGPILLAKSSSSDDYAAARNNFRPPSFSSDEFTPSSTIALGNNRRRFDLHASSDDVAFSSTTALATNRSSRNQYLVSPARNSSRTTSSVSVVRSRYDQMSPRVVEIDKVISKYTNRREPRGQIRYPYSGYRYELNKPRFNAY